MRGNSGSGKDIFRLSPAHVFAFRYSKCRGRNQSLQEEGGKQREFCVRKGAGKAWGGQHHGGRLPFVLGQKEKKGMSKSAEMIRCSRVLAGGKGWRDEGVLTG